MRYTVCLEEMEGRWVAHVPALWGCFASADECEAAQALAPQAIRDYLSWRQAHGDESVPLVPSEPPLQIAVDEIIREWLHPTDPDGYVVNAFFAADVAPLAAEDISQAQRLLEWSRADLLEAANGLTPDVLKQPVEGEWSIGGILNHTSRAEWWYLTRLGLAPPADHEPGTWRERLDMARARLMDVLPQLLGVARVEVHVGEVWSPRKMLRRALWHERDHTHHILQFRARLGMKAD